MCVSIFCVSSDIIDFFCCKKTLRYKKPKPFFTSHQSRKASSSTRVVTNDDDDDDDDKRERGPRKPPFVVSWWRWWWSKSCLSVSSSNRELSPLFETASCRDPHTQKKGGGDIFAIISIRRTHTQQRERPTVVVTLPVFFAAFGTTRRSRDQNAKPKRGCATQRTTSSKTRRWCA